MLGLSARRSVATAGLRFGAALLLLLGLEGASLAGGSVVELAQLKLSSQPQPDRLPALDSLAGEVALRTSVETAPRTRVVSLTGPERFEHPFLALVCDRPLAALTGEEEEALAGWLRMGGTLLVDWQGDAGATQPFVESLERLSQSLFPGSSLERIPESHVLHRSFYRLRRASGRLQLSDDAFGIVKDGRFMVVVSLNDSLSAVARAADGSYRHEAMPGGEEQREEAIRFLVNVVVYALCQDYKDDKVHLEYLRSRRNWQLPGGKP